MRNGFRKKLWAICESPPAVLFLVGFLFFQIVLIAAGASEDALPRKWGSFELGASKQDVRGDLKLFQCNKLTPVAVKCRLFGYPDRDDFIVLKFYKEKLVSVAEFRAKADWEKTLAKVVRQIGEPTLPAYRSEQVISHIWQDKRTHITLTHLKKTGYIVYDMRDRVKEPLYRKSLAAAGKK